MYFKEKIRKIVHMNAAYAAQDWDIRFFVECVFEFAKLSATERTEHPEYRKTLRTFCEKFSRDIEDSLRNRKDILNYVHKVLFGTPWGIKGQKAPGAQVVLRSIITAITSYVPNNRGKVEAYLKKMPGFMHPGKMAKKVKGEIVADVQAVLKTTDNIAVLDGVLNQKKLIWSALNNVLNDIVADGKRLGIPGSKGRDPEEFIEPIFNKIILEIEAKIALLRKKVAAAAA
jgi:hypothetical protein